MPHHGVGLRCFFTFAVMRFMWASIVQNGFGGLLLCLLLLACHRREIVPPPPFDTAQWAYFPLEIGQYAVYQVDSVVFDFAPNGDILRDSSRTWVKEIVVDTLRDQTGDLYFRVERYEKNDPAAPWAIRHVWTANRNETQAIRVENNLRFLKLVFPMDRRSAWDGNLWIDDMREIEIAGERMRPFSNWAYEVDSIDIQALVGQFSFDSTLLVTEADDTNLIERRFSRARYAKHVGLVWREQWILDSQYCAAPTPPDCETRPWEQKAEKGYILRQTILEFN